MFHVQLRDGQDVARAFNLDEAAVRRQFIEPLRGDALFAYADKEWDPRRTKLIVLEGRKLVGSDLMLGRGWQTAERHGTDVTDKVLAQASAGGSAPVAAADVETAARLKDRIAGRLTAGPLAPAVLVEIASDLLPGARVSAALALGEQALWEMLHAGAAALEAGGAPVGKDGWQAILLAPQTWLAGADVRIRPAV